MTTAQADLREQRLAHLELAMEVRQERRRLLGDARRKMSREKAAALLDDEVPRSIAGMTVQRFLVRVYYLQESRVRSQILWRSGIDGQATLRSLTAGERALIAARLRREEEP